MLYVTDNATGNIHAFDLTGNALDWAATGLADKSLAGVRVHDGALWLGATRSGELYRFELPE